MILNIDTTSSRAFVSIAKDGLVVQSVLNDNEKDHAIFLHRAVKELMLALNTTLDTLDAVAVSAGPGSYTGLRVAMSSAKGLCFALNKPLISISSLYLIATAVTEEMELSNDSLVCPMIDARRMEVFTTLYNKHMEIIEPPRPLILNENSFKQYLDKQPVVFSGDGAEKFINLVSHIPNAIFHNVIFLENGMGKMTFHMFKKGIFTNLAYGEPFYLKAFQDNNVK
ncbi:MAG: tRNA (adenosine(37)-N6)-threonylcarbamoyltransferase complex dimerization subunit type 1 TsaB [Ferruginibacter sp.]